MSVRILATGGESTNAEELRDFDVPTEVEEVLEQLLGALQDKVGSSQLQHVGLLNNKHPGHHRPMVGSKRRCENCRTSSQGLRQSNSRNRIGLI